LNRSLHTTIRAWRFGSLTDYVLKNLLSLDAGRRVPLQERGRFSFMLLIVAQDLINGLDKCTVRFDSDRCSLFRDKNVRRPRAANRDQKARRKRRLRHTRLRRPRRPQLLRRGRHQGLGNCLVGGVGCSCRKPKVC
jgi:hypothetical protein